MAVAFRERIVYERPIPVILENAPIVSLLHSALEVAAVFIINCVEVTTKDFP